jgi:hypothetical protein
MAGRRFFILDETIPASEIESFMCRVVTLKNLPLTKFAPFHPISPGEPSHNTHDIIPSILPNPSLSTSRKEFLKVVHEREINIGLTALFGLDFARNKEESRSLESQLVKRYTLSNPEHHFQTLMQNEYYARDIRTLLDSNKLHHAYLVTGFLTTTGAVWKIEASCKETNGFNVVIPVSTLASIPVPDLLDFSANPKITTTIHQKREMCVAEEEIFAVSYSIVKQSYGFNRSAFSITKTLAIGRPKRAKAHHLALSHNGDSDEEIDASSSDDEYDDDNAARERDVNIQLGNDLIFIQEEDESSSTTKNKYILI